MWPSAGMDEDARARPLMDAAFVERFVAMDGTGYDDIRRMLGRCRAQVSSVDSGGPTAALTGPTDSDDA